jgi:hypothetical protein
MKGISIDAKRRKMNQGKNKRVAPPSENHPRLWVACCAGPCHLAASPLAEEEQHSRSGNRLFSPHISRRTSTLPGQVPIRRKIPLTQRIYPRNKKHLNLRKALWRKLFPRSSHNITDPRPRFLVHVTGNIALPGRTVSLQFLKYHASQSCEYRGGHDGQ